MSEVILVDEQDVELGAMEKIEAHEKGVLHRAFSILVFNSKRELLLQKRNQNKYHSGGLWTNTCCSHPAPGEEIAAAARSKLHQEMGIDVQPEFAYKFIYKTSVNHNLIEHEYDHVFTGRFDGIPEINSEEVEDWRFVDMVRLRKDIQDNPGSYTSWFKLIISHPELDQISRSISEKS
jgi:isopentenyl-diphosphate Delta-isomerase